MLRIVRLALALTPVALIAPGTSPAQQAQNPKLLGTVGPGPTITLTKEDGSPATGLQPGTYDIVVSDRSDQHNFHITGPGVDQATDVEFVGEVTWVVNLGEARYRFVCDPHANAMNGTLTIGNPPPPPPPPAPAPAPVTVKRLVATVGPSATISLRTPAGARVTRATAGLYTIVVRDRSRFHNFHLIGTGLNRKTTIAFVGTTTWTRVRFVKGKTYRFVCDPHAQFMKGTFRVV